MNREIVKSVVIPIALLIAAFLLRLYAALVPGIIVPDGIVYIDSAKMVTAGQWQRIADIGIYSLYPFLIALFHKIFTNWETAGRMISVIFGSLAVLPFYYLLKRMFGLRIALVAAVFFVISPRLVEYSSNVIREPVFWFFSLAALWSAWEGLVRRRWIFITLASLFVGLSALTRMEGAAFGVLIVLWMCWYCLKVDRSGFKKLVVYLVIFCVSFPILFITPLYLLKNRLGKWEIGHIGTKIPYILSVGDGGTGDAFKDSIDGSDAISRMISQNKYVYFIYESIYKFLRSYHVILIFLFLIGIVRRRVIPWNPDKEIPMVMWCYVFFLVFLLYVSRIYYLSTRHGMLISIPALVWVSIGFFELSDIIRKRVEKVRPYWTQTRNTTVWLLVFLCIIILPKTLSWSGHEKIEMKKAGNYLKDKGHIKGKMAVEQRFSRLAFYADADFVVIPRGTTPQKLMGFLKSNNVDILVIDERSVDETVPGFMANLATVGLERLKVREFDIYKEYSIAVFRPQSNKAVLQEDI